MSTLLSGWLWAEGGVRVVRRFNGRDFARPASWGALGNLERGAAVCVIAHASKEMDFACPARRQTCRVHLDPISLMLLLILAVIFYFLAIVAGAVSAYSRSWPSVSGHRMRSWVEEEHHGGHSESGAVCYEYEVRGRSYRSTLIRPTGDLGWSTSVPGLSSALETVREMSQADGFRVYYCPRWPAYACLKPGGEAMMIYLIVVGSLCLLLR